jgi:hypothetical protein
MAEGSSRAFGWNANVAAMGAYYDAGEFTFPGNISSRILK